MSIPWEPKGRQRNPWGLLAHAVGGGGIASIVYGLTKDVYGFEYAVLSVMLSVCFGLIWESVGWAVFRWPANSLDLLPWPLGALTVSIALLAGLGA